MTQTATTENKTVEAIVSSASFSLQLYDGEVKAKLKRLYEDERDTYTMRIESTLSNGQLSGYKHTNTSVCIFFDNRKQLGDFIISLLEEYKRTEK